MGDELTKVVSALQLQADALNRFVEAQSGNRNAGPGLPAGPYDGKKSAFKSAFTDTSASAVELHGDGSLFGSVCGLERDIISAHIRPVGIASVLPLLPSVSEDPRYGILTGFSDDIGEEPVNPCDPAPTGYMKAGNLTSRFGRLVRDTETIDIDKVMLQRNRGDFTDLVLRGRVLGLTDLVPSRIDETQMLNIVTAAEMVNVGVRIERKLSRILWTGSLANNTAGGGYKESPGLEYQVATGHVDADTNVAMPAADSYVDSFGYNLLGGPTRDIVEHVSMMEYTLRYKATRQGLDPVTWVFVMRPEMWFELSAVWPCSYLTHRCGDSDGNAVAVINDDTNVRMRDEMRNGNFIIVNGNRYPVIVDDGLSEQTNVTTPGSIAAGQFASSIYMLPLTITGGFPVLYREYLDYRASTVSQNIALLNGKERFWTDDGVYMWVYEQNRWCYLLSVKTEQRVVLRTPQLAGVINDVLVTPLRHLPSSDPSSVYWQDGGVSLRSDTMNNFSAVWK